MSTQEYPSPEYPRAHTQEISPGWYMKQIAFSWQGLLVSLQVDMSITVMTKCRITVKPPESVDTTSSSRSYLPGPSCSDSTRSSPDISKYGSPVPPTME